MKTKTDRKYYSMARTERALNRRGIWSAFHAVFRAECKGKYRMDKRNGFWSKPEVNQHEAEFDNLPIDIY